MRRERETIESLTRENDFLRRTIREREVAEAQRKLDIAAKTVATEDAKAKAQAAEALAVEIEETRRGAWVNHRLAEATARGAAFEPTGFMASIPETVWPPGVSVTDFHFAGMPGGKVVDDVGETRLMKLARERGILIP